MSIVDCLVSTLLASFERERELFVFLDSLGNAKSPGVQFYARP
jgi:hypothetical protein